MQANRESKGVLPATGKTLTYEQAWAAIHHGVRHRSVDGSSGQGKAFGGLTHFGLANVDEELLLN